MIRFDIEFEIQFTGEKFKRNTITPYAGRKCVCVWVSVWRVYVIWIAYENHEYEQTSFYFEPAESTTANQLNQPTKNADSKTNTSFRFFYFGNRNQ